MDFSKDLGVCTEVDFFVPCYVDQFYPEAAFAAVRVLEALGCSVNIPSGQTCCGQPAYNAGFWEEAKPVACKWLDDFSPASETQMRPVVVLSSSCTGMVRNAYGDLLAEDFVRIQEWKSIRPHVMEWVEFVHAHPRLGELQFRFPHRVSYHDACSALRECGIRSQVRDILARVEGLELIEIQDGETCCGFGGTFAVKFEGISTAMADQKISHFLNTGAEYLVSADLSCLMHLQAYADHLNSGVRTLHLAQVLAHHLGQ
jgi:L-lactate dehydrogenase complex protein LldE